MNLLVDIGNTLVKCAVTERGRIVAERRCERLTEAWLDALLAEFPADRAIVSSTRGAMAGAVELVRSRIGETLHFTQQTPVPIGNAYRSPETLGLDRLAAAVGVATCYPGRNVLVVDCGTALTIDLVTADGVFRGGCISPGVRMRLEALHAGTATLPLCEPAELPADSADSGGTDTLLGGTTEEAIVRGVMQSVAFEIEGYAARFRRDFADLCIIFTGGDAHFFEKRIKNTIFADHNPVFCGLERILEYHVREK